MVLTIMVLMTNTTLIKVLLMLTMVTTTMMMMMLLMLLILMTLLMMTMMMTITIPGSIYLPTLPIQAQLWPTLANWYTLYLGSIFSFLFGEFSQLIRIVFCIHPISLHFWWILEYLFSKSIHIKSGIHIFFAFPWIPNFVAKYIHDVTCQVYFITKATFSDISQSLSDQNLFL